MKNRIIVLTALALGSLVSGGIASATTIVDLPPSKGEGAFPSLFGLGYDPLAETDLLFGFEDGMDEAGFDFGVLGLSPSLACGPWFA